ncbi:MAG: calcineurin-like phosphoesterase family protein [Gemmatimonadales bacterium]|nr:calcineurin-like phosphoesterase family protein [Gemmatimonadales bacterium]
MRPDRRAFLRDASLAALAAAGLPRDLVARATRPLILGAAPVRVRGRVHLRGRGLAGVGVSDGLQVVRTAADGRYELVTTSDRQWVTCHVPAAAALPLTPTGMLGGHVALQPDPRGEQRADFALDPVARDEREHAFLLIADPQTQNAFEMGRFLAETMPDAAATVQGLGGRAAFGVACGDIMYDDLALYPDYERGARATGLPFVSVVGNHDLDLKAASTFEASFRTFAGRYGPAWRAFDRGEVHYVVLNDVFWHGNGYIGYVTDEQLQWLAADLAGVERGRTVVVLLHIPLLSTRPERSGETYGLASERVQNRAALHRLLEPYRAHVLAGHTHEHEHVFDGGVHEHIHATACGAWWSGHICWDGSPNGYGVYEVSGGDVRWRLKGTGLDAGRRAALHAVGSDPTAPEEFVANVWDWDPQWRVTWFENGERRGPMARRRGKDPRAVAEQTGPQKPPRRSWVEPMPTDHLFYARPTTPGAAITVEITDRWGKVFVERMG